jgi:hypothetical protein
MQSNANPMLAGCDVCIHEYFFVGRQSEFQTSSKTRCMIIAVMIGLYTIISADLSIAND